MLLINPQKNRRDQLGGFANYVPLNVPFGIGFLAGFFDDRNFAIVRGGLK